MDEPGAWAPNGTLNVTLVGPELKHGLLLTVIICVAYLAVFVVGVLGNICVVLVVCCFPRMRSLTNLFIANLAVADLLVNVVCVPFTLLSNVMDAWVLGDLICKAVPYLQGVSVSASIHTLVCISLERCLAICCPLRCQLDARACRLLITAVWMLSLSITLPWVVVFDLEPLTDGGAMICYEAWPTPFSEKLYFAVAHLCLCYLLPLTCISVCYALIWRRVCRRKLPGEAQISGSPAELMLNRSKMKVVKMLLVVVVSFALSWMPLYVLVSRLRFGPAMGQDEARVVDTLMPFAQWLGTSNSCINPIFYAYFNRRFRKCFMTVLSSSHYCCSYPRFDYGQQYYGCSRAQRLRVRLPPVQAAQEEGLLSAKGNLDGHPASPSASHSPSLISHHSHCISSSPSSNLISDQQAQDAARHHYAREPHPSADQRFAVKRLLSALPRTTAL